MSALKDIVKRSLYFSGYYAFRGRLRANRPPRLLILTYHDFRIRRSPGRPTALDSLHPTAEHFEAHLREVTNRYRVVGLRQGVMEARNGALEEDSVAITFDDGFESIYTTAYPLLQKYSVPATIFVLTGWVNDRRPMWWNILRELVRLSEFQNVTPEGLDEAAGISTGISWTGSGPGQTGRVRLVNAIEREFRDISEADRNAAVIRLTTLLFPSSTFRPRISHPLDWPQIREMAENGLEIESHSCSHINVRHTPIEMVERELVESKEEIENRIQKPVTGFAYPYGKDLAAYAGIHGLLERHGFSFACTTAIGVVEHGDDVFSLQRNSLPLTTSRTLVHRDLILHFSKCRKNERERVPTTRNPALES
jgi:peptidoglycan/xylan/chitin deacetylase (PgdA/CDA1 family)